MWMRPSATSASLSHGTLRRVALLPWIKRGDDHSEAIRSEICRPWRRWFDRIGAVDEQIGARDSGLPPAYPIPVPDRVTPTYERDSLTRPTEAPRGDRLLAQDLLDARDRLVGRLLGREAID